MNQPSTSSGFDLNKPTIVALLYLGGYVTGGLGHLVGVVLAFIWKGEVRGGWEESHFTYLINTFWIGLVGSIVSFVLIFVLIGFLTWVAVAVLVLVRTVLSLINAQKQMPMPEPGTWKW